MSVENARNFIEKISQDENLRKRVESIPQDNEAVAVEQGLQIAAEAGFNFSAEDFKEATSSSGNLSDEDLAGVSGGFLTQPTTGEIGSPGWHL